MWGYTRIGTVFFKKKGGRLKRRDEVFGCR